MELKIAYIVTFQDESGKGKRIKVLIDANVQKAAKENDNTNIIVGGLTTVRGIGKE